MIYVCAGWRGWTLLLACFLCASVTSRIGLQRKTLLGIAEERGGRRGAGNALANTGIATAAAALAALSYGSAAALLAMAAALVAGASDTVASEIGKAWGTRTWAILPPRPVRPGTPGAMSIEGTAAGLASAAALAGLAVWLSIVPGSAIAADRHRLDDRRARGKPAGRGIRTSGRPQQRRSESDQHGHCRIRSGVGCRGAGVSRARAAAFLELSRPFTLVAPALGFASGAATAAGAVPREVFSRDLVLFPLIGLTMAAVLNAASNALNQIYDLEIDRVNKPRRPLPSGRHVACRGLALHRRRLCGGADPRVAGRSGWTA